MWCAGTGSRVDKKAFGMPRAAVDGTGAVLAAGQGEAAGRLGLADFPPGLCLPRLCARAGVYVGGRGIAARSAMDLPLCIAAADAETVEWCGWGVGRTNGIGFGGGWQRFDAREREVRLQVERRETEFAAEREELQRRIRELEALLSGSGGDKAELTLLRTKVKQLQDTLEKEVRCSQDQQRNAKDAEDEARVVRGDLKVLKEKLEKVEKAEKDNKSEVEVCPCVLLCPAS